MDLRGSGARTGRLAAASGLLLVAATGPALGAGEPVAIVEDIEAASVTDLGFSDLVFEGREIALGAGEKLVLAYLTSCRVEEITGGRVKVGHSKSEVAGSEPVIVSEVDCDGGGIVPTERQGEDVAGLTFRKARTVGPPPVRTTSTTPIFAFSQPVGELVIERADPGRTGSVTLAVAGPRLDLAGSGVALEPGALYRATAGGKTVQIVVTRDAVAHQRSLVERLIGF